MGNVKRKAPLRFFQLKLRDKESKKIFDQFQKIVIFDGKSVTDVIMALIKGSTIVLPGMGPLMFESEMLEEMKRKGVSRTRQMLKRMRDDGRLVDEETGDRLWGTDGNSIVYNSPGVIKLLKKVGRTRPGRAE